MRNLLLTLAVIAFAACSSSTATAVPKANVPQPDFEIRQLVGPAELNYDEGPIEVKYRFDIGNRADVPITLTRVQIDTVNPPGGAYTIQQRTYSFRKTIQPHQISTTEFWAKAYGYGRSMRDSEPVTVKGTLYFESPNGYIRKVFIKELGQYPGQND